MRGTAVASRATVLLLGITGSLAFGQLPPNQVIFFKMHETPTDPQSAVKFVVTMNLAANQVSGNNVGWTLTSLQFRKPGATSASDQHWLHPLPAVPSADGLWWVKHAVAMVPQVSEFAIPPLLTGTAAALDPGYGDLNYSLQGRPYFPPPTGAPYPHTAALTYAYQPPEPEAPPVVKDDEPVESGGVFDSD